MEFSELVKRSDAFVKDITFYSSLAVQDSEKLLVEINKKQMLASKTSTNEQLVNSLTGSSNLSAAYAKRSGKTKPNLFIDGTFMSQMFLETNENNGTYFLGSFWSKTKYLIEQYSDLIFGISNKNLAKRITTDELTKLYRKNVL